MATYLELFGLNADSDLLDRVTTAVVIKAQSLLAGVSPTAPQVTWAVDALSAPKPEAVKMLRYALAANKSLTVAQIQAASDSALQTNIDAAVDVITSGVI